MKIVHYFCEQKKENMRSHLKTGMVELNSNTVVDHETGEVLAKINDDPIKHTYVAGKDNFYLMYSYLIDVLKECKDLKIKVYAYLLETYKGETKFQIGKPVKKLMAEKLNTSVSSISNILTVLKQEKLIYSPDRGLYMLNPRYAFRGSSKKRNSQLKVVIELGCKDC